MRALLLPLLPLMVIPLSCGGDPGGGDSCERPVGCREVTRDGSCACLAWEAVSIKPVPVKYVVLGVQYAALGTGSSVAYGFSQPSFPEPPVAADVGARWRAVVRTQQEERVASLGPVDAAGVRVVTGTSVAGLVSSRSGTGTHTSTIDVSAHSVDAFSIWMNPTAVVTTDAAGGRSVAWSSTDRCGLAPPAGGCGDPMVVRELIAAELTGALPPFDAYDAAVLDALDAEDRAAILALDPFFDPAKDPSTIPGNPRFEHVRSFAIGGDRPRDAAPVAWTPCTGSLDDAEFPVLAASPAVAYGTGERLVVEYSAFSADAACVRQEPWLDLGTSTPGCTIAGDVYVDRVFGTVLTLPSAVSPECTTSTLY